GPPVLSPPRGRLVGSRLCAHRGGVREVSSRGEHHLDAACNLAGPRPAREEWTEVAWQQVEADPYSLGSGSRLVEGGNLGGLPQSRHLPGRATGHRLSLQGTFRQAAAWSDQRGRRYSGCSLAGTRRGTGGGGTSGLCPGRSLALGR